MNRFFFILIVTVIGNTSVNAEFPDDPKPCKFGDSDCITKAITNVMQKHSEGDTSLNLAKIDPLVVSKISIKQGEDSPVNIDLKFNNNLIYGFKDSVITKVKGFSKDLTQKHEVHLRVKSVSMVGDYNIKGKVLILPISGADKFNITLVNFDLMLYFSGTPVEKNGATYMKINDMRIDIEPERVIYYFGNLFNGDKELGDNMNLFLNENWKDIFNEVKNSFTSAFAKIFQGVVNRVFEKYPYEKYFAEN